MSATVAPIRFRNRYTGQIETEAVYGGTWLRWAYGTAVGRLALWAAITRPWFSRWYGRRMDRPSSRARVLPFIREFGLNPAEFADPPDAYRTFNEFFYRRLRPEVRPIHADPGAVVFPADGRHLGFASLSEARQFFVKGQRFDFDRFLGDPGLTARFRGGPAVFSRLCPVDYHRFHFPVAGLPGRVACLQGRLWSVNPMALRQRLACLWENRRWRTEIDGGADLGQVLLFEIGATNVGSAVHTHKPGHPVLKGEEKGYFRFGGSAILTLFQPGRVRLCEDLLAASADTMELYAHVGDVMAWRG